MRPKSGNISLNYRQRRIASFIRRPNSTPRNAAARRQSFILSRKISKFKRGMGRASTERYSSLNRFLTAILNAPFCQTLICLLYTSPSPRDCS